MSRQYVSPIDGHIDGEDTDVKSICRSCFHSYVCQQFNENRHSDNQRCHFHNDHFVATDNVVEVVRCKDCKHCEFFYSACDYDGNLTEDYYCNAFRTTKKPTDFCSYGERKRME